jgi:hypothetical protein
MMAEGDELQENNEKMEDRTMLQRIHDRVYNGIPAEIREEVREEVFRLETKFSEAMNDVKKEVRGILKMTMGILGGLFLLLAGNVILGQLNSNTRGQENNRNLEAIQSVERALELHQLDSKNQEVLQDGYIDQLLKKNGIYEFILRGSEHE